MPTPTKGARLGGSASHQKLMLANMATSLFEHGRITTTEAKAKRLRPVAERLITFAKRGDLHARRIVMQSIRDKDVVHHLFAEIGPRYADRPGGYTRIIKIGPRKGDNAPMAIIELVEQASGSTKVIREAEAARGTKFAKDEPAATAAAETAEAAEPAGAAEDEGGAAEQSADAGTVDAEETAAETEEATADADESAAEAGTADDHGTDGTDSGEDK